MKCIFCKKIFFLGITLLFITLAFVPVNNDIISGYVCPSYNKTKIVAAVSLSCKSICLETWEVWINNDYNNSTSGWGIDHFDKIQDGIDCVKDGGTVHVYSGTYAENLVIDKTVNLIGEDRNMTIIDGGNIKEVVNIVADEVHISNFTIKNSRHIPYCAGIQISSNNNTIEKNNICNNYYVGIGIFSSSNNIIKENNIYNNSCGILVNGASKNIILSNNITSNSFVGIFLEGVKGFKNNNFSYNNLINNHINVGEIFRIADGIYDRKNVWYKNYYDDYIGLNHKLLKKFPYIIRGPIMYPPIGSKWINLPRNLDRHPASKPFKIT